MNDNKERSEKILKAAESEFSSHGFAGARMDIIAKKAKVNKATIYYAIGDKEELYERVLQNMVEGLTDSLKKKIKKTPDPEEGLKIYIRTLAEIIDKYPNLANIILFENASGGRSFPGVLAREIAGFFKIISAILKSGEKKGLFIKTNPLHIHLMVMGVYILFKTTSPIRDAQESFPENIKNLSPEVSESLAPAIENYVLKALKK